MPKQPLRIWDVASNKRVTDFIAGLDPDKKWVVTVDAQKDKRSLNQNALFHKWVGEIAIFTGDNQTGVKGDLKAEFAEKTESKVVAGQFRPMDTSEMDKHQMAEFMTRIQAWAGPFGIYLTNPDDLGRD